ncbi:muscle M-line assembly protein unc-89-like isoform X2 [Mytilus californianus]|uniref:muscle M-line assembly protein unc-89-like isoform X2 n=1 Tax=Mytilus californianus TaxID=6549 RepID=UPI0022470885|nr:muscle M-line assembly protein unc-89-like isoform X2 [Mytilus californianus]
MADSICSSSDEEEILTYKLRIHDADISDSGKWQCEVKDKYGTVSTTCDLDVFEAKRQSLVSGSDIKVVQNGTLVNGKSANGTGSDSEEEILTYRLKIHDADIKDAGRWKCEVKDKHGTASTSCDLDVYDSTPASEEPRFLMSLRNVTALEGQSIKLICRVRGTPLPKIIWYKDDVPISKDDYSYQVLYLKDGTISLEIFYPKPDKDAAVFKCEAQNDKGLVTSEAKVTVLSKKREESMSRDHLLNLSQWSRARSETRRAASESRTSIRATSESRYSSSSSLKSSTKKLEDYYINRKTSKYGNYECDNIDAKYDIYKPGYTPLKFLNTNEMEPEIRLKIKWGTNEEFYFQENLKNKCILEGSRAFLSCYLVGKLPMYVQWYKDGKALLNNVYERYGIRQRAGHLSLEIPCTDLEDTGDYLVDVRNEQGRSNSSCYLQIEPRFKHDIEFEKPTFLEGIRHIHVNERQTATFQVIAKGKPKPGITWYKDGKRIQVTEKTTIHNGQKGGSLLMIHTCDFSDQGLYKVEAHNMAGRCSGSAKLSVFESGTRFTCGEDGDIKIIRRKDSLEDEEIDTENLSRQSLLSTMEGEQSSIVNKGETESLKGFDEMDITLKKSKTVTTDVNGDLKIVEATSKIETVKGLTECEVDSSVIKTEQKQTETKTTSRITTDIDSKTQKVQSLVDEQDRSENIHRSEVKSEISESMELMKSSDLKISSTTNSSFKMSEISKTEKADKSNVSSSLDESESIASTEMSKAKSAMSVVQKSTTEIESNVSVTVDTKLEETQDQNNELETKMAAKESDSLDGPKVTGDLQRTASFEAIEKARRLSKGDVKLEKLYSPNADGGLLSSKFIKTNGKLSRGSSIDESEKPRRKLSKGASVEDAVNGLANRRLSKGSPVEDSVNGLASRQLSKGSSMEETGNGKIHRKLSKGLSVEDTGNGRRKEVISNEGSIETKVTQSSSESMESSKVTQSSSESMEISKVTCEADQILTKANQQTNISETSLTESKETKPDESKDETLTLKPETVVTEIVPEKANKTEENACDSKQTSTEITPSEDKPTEEIQSRNSKSSQEIVTSKDAEIVKTQPIVNNESAGVESSTDKKEVKSSSEKIEDRISTEEKGGNTDNKDFTREQTKELEASLIADMKTDALASPVLAFETTSDIKSNTDDAKMKGSLKAETKSYDIGAQSSIEESKVVETMSEVAVESSQDKFSSDEVDAAVPKVTFESSEGKHSSETSKSIEKTTESSEGKHLVETSNPEVSENKSSMVTAKNNSEEKTEEMNSNEASSVKPLKSEKEMSIDVLTKKTDSVSSIEEQLETSGEKVKSTKQTSMEDKSMITKGQEIEEKSLLRSSDKMFVGGEDVEITTEEESSKTEEKETIYTTPPNIVKFLPKVVEIKDGETLKLQCLVSGEPKPKVVWLHNSQRITSTSDHIILTSKEQYHNLEITKTKFLRDAGIYALKASNISGEQESHSEVQIEGSLKISTVDSKEELLVKSASEEISDIKEKSIDVKDKKNLQSNLKNVDEQKDFISDVSEKTDFNTKSLKSEDLITSSLSADKKKDFEVEVDRASKKDLDISMVEDKKASALDAKNISEKTSSNVNNDSLSSRDTSTKMSGDRKVNEIERIESVQAETCMTNAPSSKKEEQSVELSGKPYFAVPLQEEYCPMERDENVRLYVKVGGEPYSPARWFKDGEELESNRRVMVNWDTVTQESTVVISRYKLKDAGVYECLILSETGAITTRTLLNLKRLETQRIETKLPHETPDLDVPLILWPIKDTTVYKGQEAYFECGVDKQPNISVKWYKDRKEIKQKKRKYNFTESKGVHTLTVEDVQDADLGSYTCEVTSTDRTVSVSANILLKAEKNKSIEIGPPKLTVKPDSLMGVAAGETAVFKCCAEANPPPLFRWTKDMVDIIQSPRVKISMSDSGESTLTISNAMYSDRGMYVCIVKNRLGRVKTRTSLHIGDEYKERDVGQSVRRETTNADTVIENNDIITKKTTLDLLSEKLDEIDIVKRKIVLESTENTTFTSEDGIDSVEKSSKFTGEFEVDLDEEAKAKLAAEVAKKDKIEAERFILLAVMEAEKAKTIAEEKVKLAKEKAKLVTEVAAADRNEAEKAALIAAEEAEKAKIEADEKLRIAAEVAKKDKIIAERVALLMEQNRIISEEAEKARISAEEAVKAKIVAEEAEKSRFVAEKTEKARIAAENARIAAENAKIAANKAEKDRIVAETEKQEETPKPKKKNHRLTFEEAEKLRLEAEVEDGYGNAENELSEKDRNEVTEQVGGARIAAEPEKGRNALEEAEKAKIAAEEADKARIASEEVEKAKISLEEEKARIGGEAEIARIATKEAEEARIAAEKAEEARITAEEVEKVRIAAEEAEKARIATEEADETRITAEEAEKARIAAEEAEKARIAAEEAEKARFAAEEAETARIAADKAEKDRIAAETVKQEETPKPKKKKHRMTFKEAEKIRLEAEIEDGYENAENELSEKDRYEVTEQVGEARIAAEAEKARIALEEAEKARIAAEEADKARIAAEEADKARIAAEEVEKAKISVQEEEKARIAAEAEKARFAAEEAEKARITAEVAEKARIASEEAEKARISEANEKHEETSKPKEKKHRMTFEEAEKLRLEAEDVDGYGNAENELSGKDRNEVTEQVGEARIAAEPEKGRNALEEAEKAKIAAEEADKSRIAAEEVEKAKIAVEEEKKARIAAKAEKTRIAVEEAEKVSFVAESDKIRLPAEAQEKEKDSRVMPGADEMLNITRRKKKHRMTFEEAENLRLESETEDLELSMNKNNIPDSTITVNTSIVKSKSSSSSLQSMNISTEETFELQRQTAVSMTSESIEEVDGAGLSKMSAKSVQKLESSQANVLETAGKGQICELKQSSVSPIDSTQQDVANQIRHQLQKQLSVGGSSCEILEVSTRRVTKSTAEAHTVEHSVSHHHIHHPPEIIVRPDSKRVPLHSELEITVRARASKHARVRWVHDGETVTFKGQHYELITEEEPIKE